MQKNGMLVHLAYIVYILKCPNNFIIDFLFRSTIHTIMC